MKKRTRLLILTLSFCLLSAASLGVLHHHSLGNNGGPIPSQLVAKSDQAIKSGGILMLRKFGQEIRKMLVQ